MKKQLIRFIVGSYIIMLVGMLIPYTKHFFMACSSFYIFLIIGILIYYVRYTRTARLGKRQVLFFICLAIVMFLLERFVSPVSRAVHSFSNVELAAPQSLLRTILVGINWSFVVYCSAAICYPIRNRFFHILAASFLVVIYYMLLAQAYVVFFQSKWPSVRAIDLTFQLLFIFSVITHTARILLRIQVKNVLGSVTYATKAVTNALYVLLSPIIG